jgi:hypothetical protein
LSTSLSRSQLLAIITGAACLFPPDRAEFIAAVMRELEGQPLGDGTVARAIREVQPRFAHPEPTPAPARWERERPRFERASKRAY